MVTSRCRSCGFEVQGMEGQSTGAVQVDNTRLQSDWMQKICATIASVNSNYVSCILPTITQLM